MPITIDVSEFLSQAKAERIPIIDVRAPKEYAAGHIPGAVNVPLFEDEERHVVGIQYKQEGREQAILKGLELVGPKLAKYVEQVKTLAPDKRLLVHCWRGGMRSQSMAWLWETVGFEVVLLEGGYKAYRSFVHAELAQPLQLILLGGKSGSGKTKLLQSLKDAGEQVIDLEALANHRGSAFGGIGLGGQPSVTHFENLLHACVQHLDASRRVWVEHESNAIGKVYIPKAFWMQMMYAPIILVEVSQEERIAHLIQEYTAFGDEALEKSFLRIQKRLGGDQLKKAMKALHEQDYVTCAKIALKYYDKTYLFSLDKYKPSDIYPISLTLQDLKQAASKLISYSQTHISFHDRIRYDQTHTI